MSQPRSPQGPVTKPLPYRDELRHLELGDAIGWAWRSRSCARVFCDAQRHSERGGCDGPHQDANLIRVARQAFDLATADGDGFRTRVGHVLLVVSRKPTENGRQPRCDC